METEAAIIPARSQQQAMDWSLVLLSQGIETTIEPAAEDHGWRLLVERPDYPRALQAIRQYRAENRRRPWVQELPWSGLIFDWRSVLWFLLLIGFYALSAFHTAYERAGIMDSHAVRAGEWWRLFTAVMLHANVAHLAANVTTGIILLGLAMGGLGPGLALLAAYLAGAAGNLAGLFLYPEPHRGLGASGMVMGALGLLTAQSLTLWRAGATARQLVVRGLLGGFLLLVLLGLNPDADVIAHVAGFIAGLFLGGVIALLPFAWTQKNWVNRLAELLCGGLVIWTWWLALR